MHCNAQAIFCYYVGQQYGLTTDTPTTLMLVGIAFLFAPAFRGMDTEEPGMTFYEAERLAAERRAQRIRREKVKNREKARAASAPDKAKCMYGAEGEYREEQYLEQPPVPLKKTKQE